MLPQRTLPPRSVTIFYIFIAGVYMIGLLYLQDVRLHTCRWCRVLARNELEHASDVTGVHHLQQLLNTRVHGKMVRSVYNSHRRTYDASDPWRISLQELDTSTSGKSRDPRCDWER